MGYFPKKCLHSKSCGKENRPRGAMGKKSSSVSAFESPGPIFDVKTFLHKP